MNRIRLLFLTVFIFIAAYLGYRHQVIGGGPAGVPPIDAYCPFGALETLPLYLTTGSFLQKTAPSNFWVLAAVLAGVLFAGAIFCGWICPLGALAEWLYKLRLLFYKQKLEIQPRLAVWLSYGRFAMLAGIVYFSWILKRLWYEEIDPYKTIFHMNVEGLTGWLIIAAFVCASLMVERAWCRFLCPLGAFIGLGARCSAFKIERSMACVHCHKCDVVCPAGITISEAARLRDTRCIKCMQCIAHCPVGALTLRSRLKGLVGTLKPLTTGIIGVILFVGVLGFAQLSGAWNAKSPSIHATVQLMYPAEIKGWMIWSEVAAAFDIEEKTLLQELGLPENLDRQRSVKSIRGEYGISEKVFRQAVETLRRK